MYSSLISLKASLRRPAGSAGARGRGVAAPLRSSGAGSAKPAGQLEQGPGVAATGNRTASEIAPKSKSVSSPRGRPER